MKIWTNKVRQHFSPLPFPPALIMMRKHFQFCFCKIFEDNKIPYQKLLILLESLSLSFNHPVSDKSADKSKDLAVIFTSLVLYLSIYPKGTSIVFLPLHVSPSYYDDNQSIHSTTSLRTAPQVAPKPYSIVRNTGVDPLFSISLILDLSCLRVWMGGRLWSLEALGSSSSDYVLCIAVLSAAWYCYTWLVLVS